MPRISFGPAFEKFWNRLLASAPDDLKSTWIESGFPETSPKMLLFGVPLIRNVIVSVALAGGGAVVGSGPTVRSFPRLAVRTIGLGLIVPALAKSTADRPISPRLIRPSVGPACGSLSVRLTLPLNDSAGTVIEPS